MAPFLQASWSPDVNLSLISILYLNPSIALCIVIRLRLQGYSCCTLPVVLDGSILACIPVALLLKHRMEGIEYIKYSAALTLG